MMAHNRRFRGQNMVEFAFAMPIFLLFLFGTMEFGWLLYSNHQVTNAAREGARWATVNGTRSLNLQDDTDIAGYNLNPTDVKDVILDRVSLVDAEELQVQIDQPDGTLEPGNRVTVEVSYPFRPLIGIVISSPTVDLTRSSTMRVHY